MGQSMAARQIETPQQKLSGVHGSPVKAGLHPKEAETDLRLVAKDTLQRLGKQESAATVIGISGGRLSAKLGDGTLSLAELERLGPTFAAEYGRQLLEQYGPLATPQARGHQIVREVRQRLDELDQLWEQLS